MEDSALFRSVLDRLGRNAVYIIARENNNVLYYNARVKQLIPEIEVGRSCRKLWYKTNEGNCPGQTVSVVGGEQGETVIRYNDSLGKCVELCVSNFKWGKEQVPAYLISAAPYNSEAVEMAERKQIRNRIEEKLTHSALDEVMKHIFKRIAYFNLDKRYIAFRNDKDNFETISDYSKSSFTQFFGLLHPEDRIEYENKFSASVLKQMFDRGENTLYLESRFLEEDGNYHWISTKIIRLKDNEEGDKIALILISSVDERKKLEIEKNDLLSSIMMILGELFVLDLKTGNYLVYKMDESVERIADENNFDQFCTRYGQILIHPLDRKKFYEAFLVENIRKQIGEGKNRIVAEVRRKDINGNFRWCELMGTLLEERPGVGHRVILTFRDVDELRRARREEKYANQRFITAVNNSYDAIYEGELCSDQLYLWKNENGKLKDFVFHSTISGQLNWAVEYSVHPDYKEEFFRVFRRENLEKGFRQGKTEISLQVPRRAKSGIYRWFSLQVQLLEITPTAVKVMFYLKDVDDVKQEEKQKREALQKALYAAEQASVAKTDFLSRMSHDIRTPMNVIMGMSQIALNSLDNPGKIEECLNKIDISADFLLSLINDVLDMSKIENGKMTVLERKIDFNRFLENILSLCQNQAESKQQKFYFEIGKQVNSYYIGDSLRLNQIILNLTSNAFKYTQEGGEISLKIDADKEENGKQKLYITVSDNGIGMSEEFMKRMFEPFEQEHSDEGRVFEGTGLGLSIIRNLVELMGGTISVTSEQGNGSCFLLTLYLKPVREDLEKGEKRKQENEEGRKRHYRNNRILLVEDNALNREISETLLEMEGLLVETAENGKIAVEKFRVSEPGAYGLIFMDIRMPVMNGLEATKQIRALPREDASRIPIIAMTANAFQEEEKEALEAGINGYLTKPVERKQMILQLEQYLS